MPEIKFDLDAVCDDCGDDLIIIQNTWPGSIKVIPCESCLNAKYEEGFTKGQKGE